MRASTTFGIGALVAGVVLGACSDDGDASPSPGGVTLSEPAPTEGAGDTPAEGGSEEGADDVAADVVRADDGVLSDGVWAVGDAGTVEFVVGDDGLELIDASAAEGWQVEIDEQSADEIEVDFTREGLEHQIEIQYEDGILEIEVDLDIDPAEPGTFEIGPAGSATLALVDGGVALDELVVADGWSVVEEDTADGDVEIELRRDAVTWELDADVDDGRLEVEIDFEIEGTYP
jgi:hypothetical protein